MSHAVSCGQRHAKKEEVSARDNVRTVLHLPPNRHGQANDSVPNVPTVVPHGLRGSKPKKVEALAVVLRKLR